MPWSYAIVHLVLAAGAASGAALVARGNPRRARALVLVLVLGVVPLQAALVRWPRALAALGWPDVVFFADAWPAIALAIAGVGVMAATTRPARLRAGALGLTLVVASFAATTVPWRGASLHLGPPVVVDGVVRQTDEGSCAPAAAATLLRLLRVAPDASEDELARACLTHSRWGTSDLGLLRGLARAAPGHRPRFIEPGLDGLRALGAPAIVFVGLRRARVQDDRLFQVLSTRCGWTDGLSHAVVLERIEPGFAVVADPGAGRERWPLEHFAALWDGAALVLDGP